MAARRPMLSECVPGLFPRLMRTSSVVVKINEREKVEEKNAKQHTANGLNGTRFYCIGTSRCASNAHKSLRTREKK